MKQFYKAYRIYRTQGWKALQFRVMQRWSPYAAWLDTPWMKWSHVLPGPPNRINMRVFAPRRSGHHAILNWIRYHLPGRHCLLNDCTLGKNPLASCARGNSLVHSWAGEHRFFDWQQELADRHAKKGTLIHNYEDCDFRYLLEQVSPEQEDVWLGASQTRFNVLILRDPFNLFASKLRWAYGKQNLAPDLAHFSVLRELWKVYAHEFLNETNYLPNRVSISYNDWFLSRDYRDRLGRQLGFINRDLCIDEVAKWGPTMWGDSFDGLQYDGQARRMKVMERWREYQHDEFFCALFQDEELWDLSRRLFGEMKGTTVLRA